MTDEKLLIKQAAKGNEGAFEELVRRYQSLVYRLCLSKLPTREDALDVSQEVLIKMWRSLVSFRFDSALSTWLYTVTQNAIADRLRSVGKYKDDISLDTGDGDDDTPPDPPDENENTRPEAALERRERIRRVREAICKLSPEHREVILLRDIEGYSYSDIAAMTGLEEGTVKSRLNRARSALKDILRNWNFT